MFALLRCQKSHMASKNARNRLGGRGSAPDPSWRAYSALPDQTLADGQGGGCPLPKNPTPTLGFSGLVCPCPLIF